MAVPDPPFLSPRIMKVLEPSAGQYEVIVRMDPSMASKFPDKPFGTAITEIGLAAKDTAKYEGYTLVSIEPADKGAKDHLWVFQNLSTAPEWTTKSNSRDNLTPAKYRGQTVVVKTEQEVEPDTQPTSISPFLEDGVTANPDYDADLVSSVVTQTPNTGKAVLTEVTETISENVDPLVGQQFAPDGTLLATSETLVTDGTVPEKSVNVAQSTVEPIGNGKSVKQTSIAKKRNTLDATVDGWPTKQKKSKGTENLTPQKYRGQTVTSVITEQVELAAEDVDNIPEPATPVSPQTVIEHEKVNDYRYEKRVITETIDENVEPLVGQQAYEERQIANVSEIVVSDGAEVDSGNLIISSSVTPLGNGKSIKQTVSVSEWAEHLSSTWNDDLMTQVAQVEQYTSPPSASDLALANTSFKIVNRDRSLRVTKVVPIEALEAVHLINEAESEVRLPDTLRAVQIIVSRVLANGDSIGVGSSYSLSGTSSVALSADMTYELEEGYSGPVAAEIHIFYLPHDAVTKEEVLSKCDASAFPRFRAKSHRVVLSGHGLSKHVEQSSHSNGMSIGESSSITALINAIALPSSLHDNIAIEVVYNDLTNIPTGIASEYSDRVTAKAQELMQTRMAALAAGERMYNLDTTIPENHAAVLSLLSTLSDQVELGVTLDVNDFPVTVTPSSIPSTDPPEVPTGRFLQSFRTTPYEYGYVQVSAVVITI